MAERDWKTRTPEPGDKIRTEGLDIICLAPAGASLISGDLDAGVAALSPGAPMLGLLDNRPDGAFALRIARDRALLCTPEPLGVDGWFGTYAASAADDLFLEFAIGGSRATDLGAACLNVPPGSPSAATRFAETTALVVSLPEGFSLRVQHPEAAAVWARLEALSRHL